MFVARVARPEGAGLGEVAGRRGLTGPSAWLGWGGFSQGSVLPRVPGVWEAPSVRDVPAAEGEEGRPVMALQPVGWAFIQKERAS